MRRAFGLISMLAMFAAAPLLAYDHFLRYGPKGEVIPEKYNLRQIPNKTVTFFVSDTGPSVYSTNDTFASVVNQIRQATQIWNGVGTSDLRVAFGGLYTEGTPDNSPGGEVVFEDFAPGVLAISGPTMCEDTTSDGPAACQGQAPSNGDSFVPILRSTMHISHDLTRIPGPSFSETFFLVAVHEMGHALGLQHTFTSSAMSTITTRSTSLSNPIHADDRAGISDLYPVPEFTTQFGSISGQVTYADDRSPVHMASVVALSSTAAPVSALTLPDGTFRINGVPPGQYFLYAHPLPPTAEILSPQDSDGNPVDPTRPFNAVVYPGVHKLVNASQVLVTAGQNSSEYNFVVTPRSAVPIYDVFMFSYFSPDSATTNAVHPAYVGLSTGAAALAATGVGIADNGSDTGGLDVQAMGGSASISDALPYSGQDGNTFLAIYASFTSFSSPGPQHLVFSTPDYLYILPNAFSIATAPPPAISSVAPNDDGTVTLSGTSFVSRTRIYFDALPATTVSQDLKNGLITVAPPHGASSQTASLTAYNADGQNSSFLETHGPPAYAYPSMGAPTLSITPSTLPAGAEAMLDIKGTGTNFAAGRTVFGFGSHDALVRQVFVFSPTHAILDLGIPAGAALAASEVTALTDFEMVSLPQAFQIQAPQSGLPAAYPVLFNGVQGQTGSFAGAIVTLYGSNLQASGGAVPEVTFNGQAATLLYASPNQINLAIPASLGSGVATMLVNNGDTNSYPVMVTIDPPEPIIVGIQRAPNQPLDNAHAAQFGDTIDVLVYGFPDPGSSIDPARVQIGVGGVSHLAKSVTQVGATPIYDVQFVLADAVSPGIQVPLVVYIDGRSSVQATIMIAN